MRHQRPRRLPSGYRKDHDAVISREFRIKFIIRMKPMWLDIHAIFLHTLHKLMGVMSGVPRMRAEYKFRFAADVGILPRAIDTVNNKANKYVH
jgi:hypothetical protein